MGDTGKITLMWRYTPTDYFEVKITDLLPIYDHMIGDGEITVSMDLDEYQRHPDIQDQLHEKFISYFKGANLTIQKPFTLMRAGGQIIYPDGRKEHILQSKAIIIGISVLSVDCCIYDSSGKIKTDTKQERLNKNRRLAYLAAKYGGSDPVVESLLSSFDKALNNPETALVHLFEIIDSLKKKFGNDETAQKAIGISSTNWKKVGRIANNVQLKQGRHSGQHVGTLRDATESELKKARDIAAEMVVGYLEYLDKITSITQ